MHKLGFAAADWSRVAVESVGPRRARKEAAKLNGPKGNGFPALTHVEVAPGIRIRKVTDARDPRNIRPASELAQKATAYNLAAVALPRVAEPLPAIRPHFSQSNDSRTFRTVRATPPTGTGVRTVVVKK